MGIEKGEIMTLTSGNKPHSVEALKLSPYWRKERSRNLQVRISESDYERLSDYCHFNKTSKQSLMEHLILSHLKEQEK